MSKRHQVALVVKKELSPAKQRKAARRLKEMRNSRHGKGTPKDGARNGIRSGGDIDELVCSENVLQRIAA